MALNLRWRLHDVFVHQALALKLYNGRSGPQLAALGFAGLVAAIAIGGALTRLRGRVGARLAVFGMIVWLGCWCAEVVSLHAIDAVLYEPINKFKLVCLVWVACSSMIGLGVLLDSRLGHNADHLGENSKEILSGTL